MRNLIYIAAVVFVSIVSTVSMPAQANTDYVVERVKDNVYRFSAGHYHSAFMVTDSGIFVTDPINPAAARYLKGYLAKHSDAPIRYLAYSHNHVDHTLGGEEFQEEGVEIIAQRHAANDLRWTKTPTALPTMTFTDELTVQLGEHQVVLTHYGPNNGRGSVSMRFLPANVMFVVDWIVLGRMPYQNLPGYDIHGMIDSTQALLNEQPFDVFIGGHADMGDYDDVVDYHDYLQQLYAEVRDGMLAGKDLATLQATIELPDYQHLTMYDEWLKLNIEGVYRTLNDMSYFEQRD